MSFRQALFFIVFMGVSSVSHTWGASDPLEILRRAEDRAMKAEERHLQAKERQIQAEERQIQAEERRLKAIVRPTPQERAAIQELLDMSPPPKTLISADRKWLQELWDKVAWTGLERKIMHIIYKEVHGKEIDLPAPDKQNQN